MKAILSIFFGLLISGATAQTSNWDALLKKHVDAKGNVNYKSFKEDVKALDQYLTWLSETKTTDWSDRARKAMWINAYNAYTVKIILNHYPLKSITDIEVDGKNAWDHTFAKVGGNTYSLNDIEHKILRGKFKDPRIHVGVNCASISCPALLQTAFTEDNIDGLLDRAFHKFVNDPSRNKIEVGHIKLSQIFEWFGEDFTKDGNLIDYLNKYSNVKIEQEAKVEFLEYDWRLNGK